MDVPAAWDVCCQCQRVVGVQFAPGDIVRWPYLAVPTARIDEHHIAAVAVRALYEGGHHVRDVDLFVRRYDARAFGPRLFFRNDAPETELEFIEPGSQISGGLVALYDGRGRCSFSPTR